MRRFLTLLAILLALTVAARGQVIGVNPAPMGLYQWNDTSNQWQRYTSTYTLLPAASTPQPVAFYAYNATLGQWVPCTTSISCLAGNSLTGLTGDVTATGPGIATATVVGIRTVSIPSLTPGYLKYTGTAFQWATSTLDIQHNGVDVTDQTTLNFLDTPPSLPSNASPVTFSTNSSGGVGAYVSSSAGTSVVPYSVPPVTPTSQVYALYPSGATATTDQPTLVTAFASSYFPFSGSITRIGSAPLGPSTGQVTWTFPALPSFINAADITAVYASVSGFALGTEGYGATLTCDTHIVANAAPGNFTGSAEIYTGSGYNPATTTCAAVNFSTLLYTAFSYSIWQPVLYIYYTDTTAPPAQNFLYAQTPLTVDNGVLGMSPSFLGGVDSGSGTAYVVTNANLPGPVSEGFLGWFVPANDNTSTTPTLIWNNTSTLPVVNQDGTALSTSPASIKAGQPQLVYLHNNEFYLQNAGGSGGGTTTNALTAAASGGAAPGTSFNGSTARTFDYHSFGAAGISGTPTIGNCVNWASANTLGDAGAACGSGGGGNTTSTSLTTNTLAKANGANSIIDSLFTDTGSAGAYSGASGFSSTHGFTTGASYSAIGATNTTIFEPGGWYNTQTGHGSVYSLQTGTNQITDSNDSASTQPVIQRVFGEALLKERATIDGASGFGGFGVSSSDHQPYFVPDGGSATEFCTAANYSTACPGSGSGTVSGQASGVIPLATASTTIGAQSHLDDGNTTAGTITSTEPVAVASAGSSQTAYTYNGTGITPGSSTTAVVGTDSSGRGVLSNAGDAGYTISRVIASGTAAMGTSSISSGACSAAVTVSATGVGTTDVITFMPNGDPTGITGYAPSATGSLYIWGYPTANNVNFKVCNNTSGAITPSALTLNWKVTR